MHSIAAADAVTRRCLPAALAQQNHNSFSQTYAVAVVAPACPAVPSKALKMHFSLESISPHRPPPSLPHPHANAVNPHPTASLPHHPTQRSTDPKLACLHSERERALYVFLSNKHLRSQKPSHFSLEPPHFLHLDVRRAGRAAPAIRLAATPSIFAVRPRLRGSRFHSPCAASPALGVVQSRKLGALAAAFFRYFLFFLRHTHHPPSPPSRSASSRGSSCLGFTSRITNDDHGSSIGERGQEGLGGTTGW